MGYENEAGLAGSNPAEGKTGEVEFKFNTALTVVVDLGGKLAELMTILPTTPVFNTPFALALYP